MARPAARRRRRTDDLPARLSWELDGAFTRAEFLTSALAMLDAVLPADAISWNAVDARSGEVEVVSSAPEGLVHEVAAVLVEVADDHPMVKSYLDVDQPGAQPRRMSDVATRTELHRTRAYAELLRPYGAEHQLTILTARAGAAGRCWTMNRDEHDFTDAERDLAVRLQPVLVAVDAASRLAHGTRLPNEVVAAREQSGLTPREVEVLELVAGGLTAAAVGRVLRIAEATVRRHLSNTYGKLGCSDRLIAVDRARRLGLLSPG